jgi:hypothetical protein
MERGFDVKQLRILKRVLLFLKVIHKYVGKEIIVNLLSYVTYFDCLVRSAEIVTYKPPSRS